MGSKKSRILFTLAVMAAIVILVNTSEVAAARDLAETTSKTTSNKINAAEPATKNTIGFGDAKDGFGPLIPSYPTVPVPIPIPVPPGGN